MDNIPNDLYTMGIGLLLCGVLFSAITPIIGMSRDYNEKQLEQQITSMEIKEERNNIFYNNTHVYQQDIVSLILKYKGDRSVSVKLTGSSEILEWSTKKQSTSYKVSDISSTMPRDKLYDSDVVYGPNGRGIVGYTFTEHQAGCGR